MFIPPLFNPFFLSLSFLLVPPSEMKLNFGFEEEDKILGAFAIGKYDSGEKTFRSARGPVDRKVHFRRED